MITSISMKIQLSLSLFPKQMQILLPLVLRIVCCDVACRYQCRGQAYDGASNMRGHLNGVAAQIQSGTPAALYVHCLTAQICAYKQ